MTQNLNVNRLKSTAWDQKAVRDRGHVNVIIPQKTIQESAKVGGATTREPMKDLTHAVCEAVYEEFEPVVRGMPVWDNVITVPVFTSSVLQQTGVLGPGVELPPVPVPNIIPHSLGRIPKGYLVVSKTGPIIVYDGPGWTPVTITLFGSTTSVAALTSSIKILVF